MILKIFFVLGLVVIFGLTSYFNNKIEEPAGTPSVDSECTSCTISSCNLHPTHKEVVS